MYAWFVFDVQPINAPIQGGLQAAWQGRGRILAILELVDTDLPASPPPSFKATGKQAYIFR